jgi:hypothetical protein
LIIPLYIGGRTLWFLTVKGVDLAVPPTGGGSYLPVVRVIGVSRVGVEVSSRVAATARAVFAITHSYPFLECKSLVLEHSQDVFGDRGHSVILITGRTDVFFWQV